MLAKFTIIVALVLGGILATAAFGGSGNSDTNPADSDSAANVSVDDSTPAPQVGYYNNNNANPFDGAVTGGY